MGIDLETFRCRNGLFRGGRHVRNCYVRYSAYTPYNASTDIHYRTFACCAVIVVLLSCCYQVLHTAEATNLNRMFTNDVCISLDVSDECNMVYYPGTLTINNMSYNISQTLLLLAADVETNPGPTELDAIITAIKTSESNILEQVRSIKVDISDMKNDLSVLKLDNENMKIKMSNLHERQTDLAKLVSNTQENVDQLNDNKENMTLDIEHINELAEQNISKIESFEEEIEKLQVAQLSSNIRIFGLLTQPEESEQTVIKQVIDNVFKKSCPSVDWVSADIKKIQVIPVHDTSKAPIIIAQLRYDDDKFKVYKGRDELRRFGIRVGNDLTVRQREKLNVLKSKGKTGYFYKGNLLLRNELNVNDAGTIVEKREFRRASRRLGNVSSANDVSSVVGRNEVMQPASMVK